MANKEDFKSWDGPPPHHNHHLEQQQQQQQQNQHQPLATGNTWPQEGIHEDGFMARGSSNSTFQEYLPDSWSAGLGGDPSYPAQLGSSYIYPDMAVSPDLSDGFSLQNQMFQLPLSTQYVFGSGGGGGGTVAVPDLVHHSSPCPSHILESPFESMPRYGFCTCPGSGSSAYSSFSSTSTSERVTGDPAAGLTDDFMPGNQWYATAAQHLEGMAHSNDFWTASAGFQHQRQTQQPGSNGRGERDTVSPKVLNIAQSPTPTSSSSESLHASFLSSAPPEMDAVPPDCEGIPLISSTVAKAARRRSRSQRARKPLPGAPTRMRSRSRQIHFPNVDLYAGSPAAYQIPSPDPGVDMGMADQEESALAQRAQSLDLQQERSVKDEFLVRSKLAGMTYKEIRAKGGFTEAESTLRGRFRTLTKNKEARVRKPEWADIDDYLLKKAVQKYAKGHDVSTAKVPWKQVAEYIANNGGSYHFGNTTCRKRWDKLAVQGGSRVDDEEDENDEEDEE